MNSRVVSGVLLVVTALLLGMVGYMAWLFRQTRTAAPVLRTPAPINIITQIAVRKINATNVLMALANRPASWASLESTNYLQYIANLRGFGCPEETVRDIILTDVAKLYARRRAELRARLQPRQYWRAEDPHRGPGLQLQQQLRALEHEQRDLVRSLLGVDLRTEMAKYRSDDEYEQRALSFLPEAKQQQVRALQQQYEDLEQDILAESRGIFLAEDQDRLNELHRRREAELAALLSADEMAEYLLRSSDTAENLRAQLAGFDASEEEFRKIFRLQKTMEDEFNTVENPADPASTAARAEAAVQARGVVDDELRKTLGEQRFAEYVRAQDPDYRSLVQLSDRYAVAPDVAARVHDMKAEALRQREALLSNQNLTYAQRQAALEAISATTRRAVGQAMSGRLFEAYQQVGAQWIDELSLPVEPPPEQ